jgi:hypothetical protein
MSLIRYRRKPGGNWYLRGGVQGVSIHESTGTSVASQAEAIKIRRAAEILERRAYGTAKTITLAEAALTYMQTGGEARFLSPLLEYAGPNTLITQIDNAWIAKAAAAIYPDAAKATGSAPTGSPPSKPRR